MKLIDKDALVAEIDRQIELLKPFLGACAGQIVAEANDKLSVLEELKNFLDTLEVKEVEEMYERPTIKIEDDISVISRLQHIDADLRPIADFIIDYASWNLHKDEWNHPVLEVPLFRVLDALVQRGKPYCGG